MPHRRRRFPMGICGYVHRVPVNSNARRLLITDGTVTNRTKGDYRIMASVSSTSSLGNTSLRGFGGMASGIQRDEIIEQMTLGTTTKINNAKKEITQIQWKQEAFRSLSDKIIDMNDNYFSYSSSSSLVDTNLFAKSLVSIHGSDKSSKYITATGTSDLINNVSITAVKQLATSSVHKSDSRLDGTLKTGINDFDKKISDSTLKGKTLTFGIYNDRDGGTWNDTVKLTFASQYKKRGDDGKVVYDADGNPVMENIDYVLPENATKEDYERLTEQLNYMLEDSGKEFTHAKVHEAVEFYYDEAKGSIGLREKATADGGKGMGDYTIYKTGSNALDALGYTTDKDGKSLELSDLNLSDNNIQNSITRTSTVDALTNTKVTFNFNGTKKEIELLTKEEAEKIKAGVYKDADGNPLTGDALKKAQVETMMEGIQSRLDRAFGDGNVKAGIAADGSLEFSTLDETSSVSVVSGNDFALRAMGISYGASSKVNLSGKLSQDNLGLNLTDDQYEAGLTINGVTIDGITKDTSVSSLLSKINSSNAGVKATYVDATGQFMLVSSETGANRNITLEGELANQLFGFSSTGKNGGFVEGQDAVIEVSYGNGVNVEMNRASNTFNLEGLNVTVSGTFGGEWKKDADGNIVKDPTTGKGVWISDTSDTVTFSAKADVDKATEKVKNFIESFNELVAEVNTQLTTRPDSSYGPLTDEQKAEMDETSIENWEKKAKQGILNGDSTIRDLSSDLQTLFTQMMNNGINYDDLQKIGITYSDDYKDGGKIVFDEAKFRSAMETEPELVSKIFAGGGEVTKGLTKTVEDTLKSYATRYASDNAATKGGRGSYGRLIEEAGSEKTPTTLLNNFLYSQIKDIQTRIEKLQSQLQTQQDRYIKQFASMETLISQMNSQSSWLSQISG